MFATYLTATVLATIANGFSAYMDLTRNNRVLVVMEQGRVPLSWMIPLGLLKAAGTLGLVIGFAVPLIGTAAAVGLVLFFPRRPRRPPPGAVLRVPQPSDLPVAVRGRTGHRPG